MPYSSSALTRLASEKRGGGSVKCCSGLIAFSLTRSPLSSAGSLRSSSSSSVTSSKLSRYTARNPGLTSVEPFARSVWPLPAERSTATVSNTAASIWLATARRQISV